MKRTRNQAPPPGNQPEQSAQVPPPPFKPRPKLLAILSILFAAWISFLLVLYFTTVHHA
jgi:hypothetical protein